MLLPLSSLSLLSPHYDFYSNILEVSYHIFIAIFPVPVGRYICAALSKCKHDRFTTSLLKFQHTSLDATTSCEWRSACDCATLGEQRLHERPPQLPLKSDCRCSGAIFMTSQLPAFVCVVAFSLVYFVQFEWYTRRAFAHKGLNILSINKTIVH